jgi:hypothetical protein
MSSCFSLVFTFPAAVVLIHISQTAEIAERTPAMSDYEDISMMEKIDDFLESQNNQSLPPENEGVSGDDSRSATARVRKPLSVLLLPDSLAALIESREKKIASLEDLKIALADSDACARLHFERAGECGMRQRRLLPFRTQENCWSF